MSYTINVRDAALGSVCMLIMVLNIILGWHIAKASEDGMTFLPCEDKKRAFIMKEKGGMFQGEIMKGCIE